MWTTILYSRIKRPSALKNTFVNDWIASWPNRAITYQAKELNHLSSYTVVNDLKIFKTRTTESFVDLIDSWTNCAISLWIKFKWNSIILILKPNHSRTNSSLCDILSTNEMIHGNTFQWINESINRYTNHTTLKQNLQSFSNDSYQKKIQSCAKFNAKLFARQL